MAWRARFSYLALIAGGLFWLAGFSAPAKAERRVALLIGNGAYTDMAPLKNPKNDIVLLSASLKKIGFDIIPVNDADQREMNLARGRFAKAAADADIALVYYAGHGMQVKGRNYLIPIKATIESQTDLLTEAIKADDIIESMEGTNARVRILILDACRNNPLPRLAHTNERGLAQTGLAKMKSEDDLEGTLIIFSTSPGKTADDGVDLQSPFASALAENLTAIGVDVFSLFNRVAEIVGQKTRGQQIPWVQGYLRSKVYLAGAPPIALARAAFDRALEEDSKEGWGKFLVEFDEGKLADIARDRLKKLTSAGEVMASLRAPSAAAVKAADSSRFILPESSSRTLTDADLKGMTVDQLRFARNEIYARKGRFFRDPGLAAHFSQFVWYKPASWDVVLTEIEQANVSFIQTAERRVSLSSR